MTNEEDGEHSHSVRTVEDLSCELDDRGVTMQVHQTPDRWVVWLYAPESPETMVKADGYRLEEVFSRALRRWDRKQ